VAKVAGWERLRLGVLGLDLMLGDLFTGSRRGDGCVLFSYPIVVFEVLRSRDNPENVSNRKFGLELDRLSGLILPARLDPWLDCLVRMRLRPLELILEFRNCRSCLARRFAIS